MMNDRRERKTNTRQNHEKAAKEAQKNKYFQKTVKNQMEEAKMDQEINK